MVEQKCQSPILNGVVYIHQRLNSSDLGPAMSRGHCKEISFVNAGAKIHPYEIKWVSLKVIKKSDFYG